MLMLLHELKPSLAKSCRTLRGLVAKEGRKKSTSYPTNPSLQGFCLCHLISLAIFDDMYNFCKRGVNKKNIS